MSPSEHQQHRVPPRARARTFELLRVDHDEEPIKVRAVTELRSGNIELAVVNKVLRTPQRGTGGGGIEASRARAVELVSDAIQQLEVFGVEYFYLFDLQPTHQIDLQLHLVFFVMTQLQTLHLCIFAQQFVESCNYYFYS